MAGSRYTSAQGDTSVFGGLAACSGCNLRVAYREGQAGVEVPECNCCIVCTLHVSSDVAVLHTRHTTDDRELTQEPTPKH